MAATSGELQLLEMRSAMHETEQLSALIGEVYDAALDPRLWANVLGRSRVFVGGAAAGLGWKDVAAKSGGIFLTKTTTTTAAAVQSASPTGSPTSKNMSNWTHAMPGNFLPRSANRSSPPI